MLLSVTVEKASNSELQKYINDTGHYISSAIILEGLFNGKFRRI